MVPSDLLAEDPAASATEETKSQHSPHKIQISPAFVPQVFVFTDAQSPDSLPSASPATARTQNPHGQPAPALWL